jgi:hypothetical protein
VQLIKVLEEKRQLDFRLAEQSDQPLPSEVRRDERGQHHRERRVRNERHGATKPRKKSYHKRKSTRR